MSTPSRGRAQGARALRSPRGRGVPRAGRDDRFPGVSYPSSVDLDQNAQLLLGGMEDVSIRRRGSGRPSQIMRRGGLMPVPVEIPLTTPENLDKKYGSRGNKAKVSTNSYRIIPKYTRFWTYHVDFEPDSPNYRVKGYLLRELSERLGEYIYDQGYMICTPTEIENFEETVEMPDPSDPTVKRSFKVSVYRGIGVNFGTIVFQQVCNILMKRVMYLMGYEEKPKGFISMDSAIDIRSFKTRMYLGFFGTIHYHDAGMLLTLSNTYFITRTITLLERMQEKGYALMSPEQRAQDFAANFEGEVVITPYNNRTYTLLEISQDLTAESTFEHKGVKKTYLEYYTEVYPGRAVIKKANQFLVKVISRKSEDGKPGSDVFLVPELCLLTGYGEHDGNQQLKAAVMKASKSEPKDRMKELEKLMTKLQTTEQVTTLLERWGLAISPTCLEVDCRVKEAPHVEFNDTISVTPVNATWQGNCKSVRLQEAVRMGRLGVVAPQTSKSMLNVFLGQLKTVCAGFNITLDPREPIIRYVGDTNADTYTRELETLLTKNPGLDQILVVLTTKTDRIYKPIKKILSHQHGIASQCIQHNSLNKGLSLATSVAIQMDAKKGGIPWVIRELKEGLEDTLVIGVDVYQRRKKQGVPATVCVASLNSKLSKWFSCRSEGEDQLPQLIGECFVAYQDNHPHAEYPKNVILIRGAVSDSMIDSTRIEFIKFIDGVRHLAVQNPAMVISVPKFTVILCTRSPCLKLFRRERGGYENVRPGTVIDTDVTFSGRADFYLASHKTRQGTVTPTHFNVIVNECGYGPDVIQHMMYNFCHVNYNFSGTIAVPAHNHYARRLSIFSAEILEGGSHTNLQNELHFL